VPGGWIECHEIDPYVYSDDGTYMKDHPLNEIYEITSGAFSRLYQWNIHFTKQIADTLRQVGFVNVHERRTRIPLGRWHHEARMREMGLFSRTSTGEWAMAMLAANNAMGITEEAADRLAERLVDALDDVAVHGSMDWLDVWAQKPSA
jgi:hypothetical protein